MGMQEETWRDVKQQLPVGSIVEGRVIRHEAYGVFVDIGLECEGLIQIVDIKGEGRASPDDYPSIGTLVVARVLGFKERGHQVWLGIKPSRLHADWTDDPVSARDERKSSFMRIGCY